MCHISRFAVVALCVVVAGCRGNNGASPTGPTPPALTRIISVSGDLSFGEVAIGTEREQTLAITNTGTGTLTVSSLSMSPELVPHTTLSWNGGTISIGATQSVLVRFSPRTSGAFSGTITVNGDQTSGNNTLGISGIGAFSAAGLWQGSYIVEQCTSTDAAQDVLCSPQRGVLPPGTSLRLAMELLQSANNVSGTLLFGPFQGPVNGVITADGTLTLQGSAISGAVTAQITSWNTRVGATTMTGSVTYTMTVAETGTAVLVMRLSGVTRP